MRGRREKPNIDEAMFENDDCDSDSDGGENANGSRENVGGQAKVGEPW